MWARILISIVLHQDTLDKQQAVICKESHYIVQVIDFHLLSSLKSDSLYYTNLHEKIFWVSLPDHSIALVLCESVFDQMVDEIEM